MSLIDELQNDLNVKEAEYIKLRNKVHALKLQRDMPILRKKYEGKCFKYENSDGNGKWPIYSFCEKVIDDSMAKVHSFESGPNGHYEFKIGQTFFFLFQTEIRKSAYNKALRRFKDNAAQLEER